MLSSVRKRDEDYYLEFLPIFLKGKLMISSGNYLNTMANDLVLLKLGSKLCLQMLAMLLKQLDCFLISFLWIRIATH